MTRILRQVLYLERLFFFLLVFFLPFQTGKHFWPSFSYVLGIRVDYLSPTLYLTDIFIALLLAVYLSRILIERKNSAHRRNLNFGIFGKLFFIFLLAFFILSFSARSQAAAVFGLLKLIEFIFLGYYISKNFVPADIRILGVVLSINSLVVSSLAIWQFLKQSSIGGIFYFLGERFFNSSTIGIPDMNIGGNLIVRPYATFPHPNVLAFFLLFVNMLLVFRIFFEKGKLRTLFLLAIVVSSVVLFLTFSRLVVLFYLVFLIYIFASRIRFFKTTKIIFLGSFVFFLVFYFANYYLRFFDTKFLLKDFYLRSDLLDISFKIIKSSSIFGIGLMNFFYYEAAYQKTISPILLQPVHNIFVLTWAEAGVFGLLFLLVFFVRTAQVLLEKIKGKNTQAKDFYKSIFLIFLAIVLVGNFDHFFLTLQQGKMLLAIVVGMAHTRLSKI